MSLQLEQESRHMLAHGQGKVPRRSLYLSHISSSLVPGPGDKQG